MYGNVFMTGNNIPNWWKTLLRPGENLKMGENIPPPWIIFLDEWECFHDMQ